MALWARTQKQSESMGWRSGTLVLIINVKPVFLALWARYIQSDTLVFCFALDVKSPSYVKGPVRGTHHSSKGRCQRVSNIKLVVRIFEALSPHQ